MKKKIFITILAVFMLAIFSVTAGAFALGDVNGDGVVKAADARLALRYSARLEELSEEQIKAADVDKSGTVNAADARTILRVSARLEVSFEDKNFNEHLIEDGVLHVAVAKDCKPFSYSENDEFKGIDVELAQKIAETADLELRLHPMPYKDMLNAVNNGECDIAAINEAPTGTSVSTVYYNTRLVALVRTSSDFSVVEDVKNNPSAKVGVLNKSMDKYLVENELGADRVTGFSTCAEATDALTDGRIDAFVTCFKYAENIKIEIGEVKTFPRPYFISEDHVFFSSSDKAALISKVDKILTTEKAEKYAEKYNSYEINSHLSLKHSSIRIAPGGAACLEVDAKSFFFTIPHIYTWIEDGSASISHFNGKTFLLIHVNTQTKSQKIELYMPNEDAVYRFDLIVDSKATKNYILDGNYSIPDFGAYTKTGAFNAMIDEATGVIAYTYSAEDLYNNGITDTSKLEGYFNALEKAGYEYMGYMEDDTSLVAMYYNEKQGKAFSYVEVYDSNGYVQEIGVGFNLFEIPGL